MLMSSDAQVSILAPRCRGARRDPDYASVGLLLFQSSPPVAGERVAMLRKIRDEGLVSILAPRCRGARRQHAIHDNRTAVVSILAPRCRGARRVLTGNRNVIVPFQSSPPVAGERVPTKR